MDGNQPWIKIDVDLKIQGPNPKNNWIKHILFPEAWSSWADPLQNNNKIIFQSPLCFKRQEYEGLA